MRRELDDTARLMTCFIFNVASVSDSSSDN